MPLLHQLFSKIKPGPIYKLKAIKRVMNSDSLGQRHKNQKHMYRGADKSLAQPGGKQGTATENSDVHISYSLS
jgi:hypothetical protein